MCIWALKNGMFKFSTVAAKRLNSWDDWFRTDSKFTHVNGGAIGYSGTWID